MVHQVRRQVVQQVAQYVVHQLVQLVVHAEGRQVMQKTFHLNEFGSDPDSFVLGRLKVAMPVTLLTSLPKIKVPGPDKWTDQCLATSRVAEIFRDDLEVHCAYLRIDPDDALPNFLSRNPNPNPAAKEEPSTTAGGALAEEASTFGAAMDPPPTTRQARVGTGPTTHDGLGGPQMSAISPETFDVNEDPSSTDTNAVPDELQEEPQQEQHLRSAAFLPWQERRERSDAATRSNSEQRKREYVESCNSIRSAWQLK
ncbi:hypothetical protein QJQ45_000480 [Haematococcus lacustris]|nr:hypothetical protein QJQ45_000480 [Haematococcus lacustris]